MVVLVWDLMRTDWKRPLPNVLLVNLHFIVKKNAREFARPKIWVRLMIAAKNETGKGGLIWRLPNIKIASVM